jgi:hypothetical protein
MQCECSLPCSQQLTIGLCSEAGKTGPCKFNGVLPPTSEYPRKNAIAQIGSYLSLSYRNLSFLPFLCYTSELLCNIHLIFVSKEDMLIQTAFFGMKIQSARLLCHETMPETCTNHTSQLTSSLPVEVLWNERKKQRGEES